MDKFATVKFVYRSKGKGRKKKVKMVTKSNPRIRPPKPVTKEKNKIAA